MQTNDYNLQLSLNTPNISKVGKKTYSPVAVGLSIQLFMNELYEQKQAGLEKQLIVAKICFNSALDSFLFRVENRI